MRIYLLFTVFTIFSSSIWAHDFTSYQKPIERTFYSKALKDSVNLEITLPKDLNPQTNVKYPVIYLLDKQLQSNYKYNLHTIDYLSSLQSMPTAILIGITFNRKNRKPWTIPNTSGGKADDLISFIINELNDELKNNYPISEFNLLIGHSRTAIFASYALSKRYDFFNATIANSVSNFDFGDSFQEAQFENFIDNIDTSKHKYFYHFSVGEKAYGDLHEPAVDKLNSFLNSKKLPETLEWKYYKYKTKHDLTPGLTVARSLNEIFKEYARRIQESFKIAQSSTHKVPWNEYLELYESISIDLGYSIHPSDVFFNSIASEYYNNSNDYYEEKSLHFALEILLKAIVVYPNDYGYHSWIGEIYLTLNNHKEGAFYLNQSVKLINERKGLPEADKQYLLAEIKELRKMAK